MSTEEPLATWCRRLKTSDREAFKQIFSVLHDALFRYAVYITGEEAPARDIIQGVFLELWDMRAQLDPSRSLEALLYRMVRNRAYNHQRNRRTRADKHAMLQDENTRQHEGPDEPDALLGAKVLEGKLDTWINDLPERQREALLLSRFEGLSHEEIATAMDISPRTVNNHLVRALKTLRDHIRSFEPDLLQT